MTHGGRNAQFLINKFFFFPLTSLRVIALAILFLIKICFKSTNVLDYIQLNYGGEGKKDYQKIGNFRKEAIEDPLRPGFFKEMQNLSGNA